MINYIDAFTLNMSSSGCTGLSKQVLLLAYRHLAIQATQALGEQLPHHGSVRMEQMERWSPWGMSLLTAVYFVTVKVSLINK